MHRWILVVLFFALVVLPVRPAAARDAGGWSVAFTHSGSGGEVTLLMLGDNLRASTAGVSQEVLLDAEGLTLVDHEDQSYMVITFDQLEATLGLMADAMQGVRDTQRRVLEAALEEMPPDQRGQLQAQLDAMGRAAPAPADFEFRAEEEIAVLAGLSARRHLVSVRGEPVAEVWLTSEISWGPLAQIIGRLERLAPLQQDVDPASIRMLRLVEGFPLKITDLSGRGGSLLVHRADPREFTPADFTPPDGYRQKSLSLDAFRN